ncbi:MAG: adenylosuccinate lyase [Candidatus Thermoplasmatota archaeon]|nr:adenylosuccinate lyase [Candidatus Thermoplasmatota archaeon]
MNLICPLDFRYGRNEIKKIFSEESRLSYQLKVEAALARGHAKFGNIPKKAAEEITRKANLNYVKIERVKEIEREIYHDVMAMAKALTEACGDAGKYVHLGATSYDIVDSANALQITEAVSIIENDLIELKKSLAGLAKKYRDTVMLGRTHGQYALPITFGMKMAVFASETDRHIQRVRRCKEELTVGKMSGAVGSGAALGNHFFEIQDAVMNELGLKAEIPSTQIVGRDRYVVLMSMLANIAASTEKFATEVRNLQRSEIGEVAEPFAKKQVGSSTMPHKRNPIICEQVCGLSRIVRVNLLPSWENAIQWHERDLCNSSSERFIIPHSIILTDWILVQMKEVFSKMDVYPEKMKENIERSRGLPMAEAVMILLVEKGMGRQAAHEILRVCSIEASKTGKHLKEVLLENEKIRGLLSEEEIKRVLDIEHYVGGAKRIVDMTLKRLYPNE